MRVVSTAAEAGAPRPSFEHAILQGWADDGGLFMPERLPRFGEADLDEATGLSYPELCVRLIARFVGSDEVPHADLEGLVQRACACFRDREHRVVTEGPTLRAGPWEIGVCELWNGPTLAFKDLGMSVLAQMLSYLLQRHGETRQLLVGTSGDTGGAALYAFGDLPGVRVICLYPRGRCSRMQELQMISAYSRYGNTELFAVDGSADDLEVPIKAVHKDARFSIEHKVGSVNSVNLLRLLMHCAHYFYFALLHRDRGPVAFSVPTGAAGHIVAGMMCIDMGLPIVGLHAAANNNDLIHRFLSSEGEVALRPNCSTNSPAMDTVLPYNIERMLWLAAEGDGPAVRSCMEQIAHEGALRVPSQWLRRLREHYRLSSSRSSNAEVVDTIRRTYQETGYVLDPHTAVGVHAANALGQVFATETGDTPRLLCMGCAHPAKFPELIAETLGLSPEDRLPLPGLDNPNVQALLSLGSPGEPPARAPREMSQGEDWEGILRACISSGAPPGTSQAQEPGKQE